MIRKLYAYLGKYKKFIVYCFLLVSGDVLCELMMPLLMAKIIDDGIPSKNIGYIAGIGVIMVVLAGLSIFLGVKTMKLSAEASQGFAANLRKSLFDKIQSFSFSNIDRFSTASLVTRLTSDITQLQNTLMMLLRMLLRAPLMLVCAIILAMCINLELSRVIFIAIPLLIIGVLIVVSSAKRLFTVVQTRIDGVNATVRENLTAIRVVKAFVREKYEKSKFKKANDALTNASIQAGNMISLVMPVLLIVLNGATLAVILLGGKIVGTGAMGTGQLLSFISYLMQIMISIMMFSMVFILFARAQVCGKRVLEVLETNPDIEDSAQVIESSSSPIVTKGKIEFKHVNFRYNVGTDGKDVLSDITFTAEPGQFVAIVGGTGSGKTTLINLISRLYETTGGKVLIDDVDVRDYSLANLRGSVGMVLQNNVLFSGTIRENLLWGDKDATQDDIEKAAADAQAADFILGFPDGYETELDQGGVNVSGGQKQRLCIARAMLKKPPILILDDSTSAVDTATDAKIQQSFRGNLKGTTVLVIAQRISSVKDADKIIVLDDGKIKGIGTHAELYENNSIYHEICVSQREGLVS